MSIKIKIKVTKEVLKRSMWCSTKPGVIECAKNCAIAIAVRDIFPDATVGISTMGFGFATDLSVNLPEIACKFIISFDSLRNKPEMRLGLPELEFEIEIPDKILDQIGNGNIEEVKTIIQNSETLELV